MNSIYNKNNFKLAKPTTNKGSFYSMVTNFSEEFITDFLFLHNFNMKIWQY